MPPCILHDGSGRRGPRAQAFTLLETVVALGLVAISISVTLLLMLAVSGDERRELDAASAHALLEVVAADLRYSLYREDLAEATASSQFGLAPLPLAGRVEDGTEATTYLTPDWRPATANQGGPVFRVVLRYMDPPTDPHSLVPIRAVLEVSRADRPADAVLARLPQEFPPP